MTDYKNKAADEFLKWAMAKGVSTDYGRVGGRYAPEIEFLKPQVQRAWEAWQACAEYSAVSAKPTQRVPAKLGIRGKAYDSPQDHRAYTYTEQPDNLAASRMGRALTRTRFPDTADYIDAGLELLMRLETEGFGVFETTALEPSEPAELLLPDNLDPVAIVRNKYGDPEAFAERELKLMVDIQKLPIGAKLYVSSPTTE